MSVHSPVLTDGACSTRAGWTAVRYRVEGDQRYLSHRDELRVLVRATARAGWCVVHSAGFNPQPRIRIPLPRSVGIASACQVALIQVKGERDATTLRHELEPRMPAGFSLDGIDVEGVTGKRSAIAVEYSVEIDAPAVTAARANLAKVLAARSLLLHRSRGPKGPQRPFDVRPFIERIEVESDSVRMRLMVDNGQTARPAEVLSLLGLAAEKYAHRVRRERVEWNFSSPAAITEADAESESNS